MCKENNTWCVYQNMTKKKCIIRNFRCTHDRNNEYFRMKTKMPYNNLHMHNTEIK